MARKTLNFFISILPSVIFLIMEFAFTIMGMIAYMVLGASFKGVSIDVILDEMMDIIADPDVNTGIMVVFESFILITYGFWHHKVISSSEKGVIPKNANIISVVSVLVIATGMTLIIGYVTFAEDLMNPAWYDEFEEMMEGAGLGDSMSPLALFYAVIMAPLAEELIFRGLTLHYAKKAFPVWIAIIYQAVLFGIFHMNIYQGIYAFVAGLFMGIVAHYGGSIAWTVLLHMVYNFMESVPLFDLLDHAYDSYFHLLFVLTVGVLVCMAGLFWFKRGVDRKNTENALYEKLLAQYREEETAGLSQNTF